MTQKDFQGHIAYIHLPVTRMDESLAWYERHLGAKISGKPHEDLGFIDFPEGPNVLLLGTNQPARAVFHLGNERKQAAGFRTTRIEELHRHMKESGVSLEPIVSYEHGRFFYFDDPDGNFFMVHQLPDAVSRDEDPLVEGIRYIEMPVFDLEQTTDWYVNILGFNKTLPGNPDLVFLDREPGPNILMWRSKFKTNLNVFRGDEVTPFIGFRVHEMDELHQYLRASGVSVSEIEYAGAVGRFCRFTDPNGNLFMVHEPSASDIST